MESFVQFINSALPFVFTMGVLLAFVFVGNPLKFPLLFLVRSIGFALIALIASVSVVGAIQACLWVFMASGIPQDIATLMVSAAILVIFMNERRKMHSKKSESMCTPA